jgi:hypothetical protein
MLSIESSVFFSEFYYMEVSVMKVIMVKSGWKLEIPVGVEHSTLSSTERDIYREVLLVGATVDEPYVSYGGIVAYVDTQHSTLVQLGKAYKKLQIADEFLDGSELSEKMIAGKPFFTHLGAIMVELEDLIWSSEEAHIVWSDVF